MDDLFNLIWDLSLGIINFAKVVWDFLSQEITVLDFDISMIALLGGAGGVALLIVLLLK